MPLISISRVSNNATLGLWRISEADRNPNICNTMPQLSQLLQGCGSDKRRAEIMAVHSLLHAMTDDKQLVISHAPTGKPLLPGWHVSVSHTVGYAALILSKTCHVAVDIEYISDRVGKVAQRFLRADEHADNTTSMLIHWCAKETMYKLLSEEDLAFEEMRINPFATSLEGSLSAVDMRKHSSYRIRYKCTNAYVLTYYTADLPNT